MNIQWFPGHMTKAIRMMEENLRLVDALIYVIDSRAVFSSNNPLFDKLIAGKRVLYVFNKCDLVEESDLALWCARFREDGKTLSGWDIRRLLSHRCGAQTHRVRQTHPLR